MPGIVQAERSILGSSSETGNEIGGLKKRDVVGCEERRDQGDEMQREEDGKTVCWGSARVAGTFFVSWTVLD